MSTWHGLPVCHFLRGLGAEMRSVTVDFLLKADRLEANSVRHRI